MIKTPYIIALYVRLSVEDCKVDSFSVENQKIALHQYVDTVESFEGCRGSRVYRQRIFWD